MAPLDGPGSDGWDTDPAESVRASLRQAMRTLQALRVPGLWPAGYRSGMPDVLRDIEDMRWVDAGEGPRPQPGPQAVARMDRMLAWVRLIPEGRPEVRRAVALRSLNHPLSEKEILGWRRIGELLGCSHTQAGRWFDQGIDHITVALARPGLCAAAGGPVAPGPREVEAARQRVTARPRVRQTVDA